MDLVRVGDKVISEKRIERRVKQIFELRASGLSQVEVAKRLGVDRTLICRLEGMGEVRKGRRIAVVGFPIENKLEIEQLLQEEGVEYYILLSEKERWDFLNQNGLKLFNYIMGVISSLKEYDLVIVMGSNYRIDLMSTIIGSEVVGVEIGKSPIEQDKYISPIELCSLIRTLKGGEDCETGD